MFASRREGTMDRASLLALTSDEDDEAPRLVQVVRATTFEAWRENPDLAIDPAPLVARSSRTVSVC
jgi:hypothetical protein